MNFQLLDWALSSGAVSENLFYFIKISTVLRLAIKKQYFIVKLFYILVIVIFFGKNHQNVYNISIGTAVHTDYTPCIRNAESRNNLIRSFFYVIAIFYCFSY